MSCHGISHDCGYGTIVNGEASQGQDLDSMLMFVRRVVVTTRIATRICTNMYGCFLNGLLLLGGLLLHDCYFVVFTTLVIVRVLQTIRDILRAFGTSGGATVIVVVGFVCIFGLLMGLLMGFLLPITGGFFFFFVGLLF